jgi:myo-inositol-1(or 4)-monophosphatase
MENMKKIQKELILELTTKLNQIFSATANLKLNVSLKADNTIVSEIDLFVSDFLKAKLNNHPSYKNFTFFSEEDYDQLIFPCAILDPIDGTREFVKGRAECAVSLALMNTALIKDPANYAWLYNPFSGFSLDSLMPFVPSNNKSAQKILGMVSRSEFEKGYFDEIINIDPKIDITPRGSIAFKLGLLASGGCDFVLSLSPKNIWDIAAGTILCSQRGMNLYQNGKKISSLDEILVNGILLWTTEELAITLLNKFDIEKRS